MRFLKCALSDKLINSGVHPSTIIALRAVQLSQPPPPDVLVDHLARPVIRAQPELDGPVGCRYRRGHRLNYSLNSAVGLIRNLVWCAKAQKRCRGTGDGGGQRVGWLLAGVNFPVSVRAPGVCVRPVLVAGVRGSKGDAVAADACMPQVVDTKTSLAMRPATTPGPGGRRGSGLRRNRAARHPSIAKTSSTHARAISAAAVLLLSKHCCCLCSSSSSSSSVKWHLRLRPAVCLARVARKVSREPRPCEGAGQLGGWDVRGAHRTYFCSRCTCTAFPRPAACGVRCLRCLRCLRSIRVREELTQRSTSLFPAGRYSRVHTDITTANVPQ